MSSSGQDIETSSVDSPQSHYESPYSSPSQQVPQLAFTLTTLNMSTASQPFLRIVEQPQDHFRFRYKSEMVGTHGCLLGKSQNASRCKTHPTVELVNYPGRAIIRCRLAQHKTAQEHPHKLLEDEQDRDVSYEVPEQGSYKVGFGGMGIIHTAKKDVPGLLYTKYAQLNPQMSPKELRAHCENEAKKINLNIVRLRFSAHDINTDEEICAPVFSDPIHNMKSASTNDLKICRISRTSGRPRGGDDVFIFVEKVNKKNIKIRFFELSPTGEEVWQAYAHFLESDVHHQYAIAFSTPQYRDPYIVSNVTVYFELQRPQDGRTSDPKEFTYRAEEALKQQNKKRRANSAYSSLNSNNSSLKSVGDVPATVMLNCNGAFDASQDVDMAATTIQSIPQIPVGGGHSPHSDLGDALLINMSANSSPAERHLYNDNPVLTQCNLPMQTLPDFNSTELKRILEHNSGMTAEEKNRFAEADWSQYFESFGSLPDETNSMTFIRHLLVSDSGVKKGGATQSTSKASGSSQMLTETKADLEDVKLNIVDKTKGQEKPFYKAEDGQEVKKLVVELVDLMRKTPLKKNIVRSKLERLVEKRLSNGDTFLHMSLNSNRPSFEYIVKMAHHLGMTHLLNLQNNKLQTILHLAIVAEAPSLAAFLVSKGCDPMLEDEEGNNAIHYAVMCREDASCLDSLLGAIELHGIPHDINASTNEKQTALHLAVTYNSVAKTRRLLRHGARPHVSDAQARTPLHVAANMNYALVMKELLDYVSVVEIDALDGRGYSALQILCDGSIQENTVEMVKMLLEKKADPRAHGPRSAWHLARNKPHLREVMRAYIVDVMDEDDIKSEPEDDIKSEPEDDSGDEYHDVELSLPEMSSYISELSACLDASGAWRALALKLSLDSMTSWYQNTASPTRTLLNFLKQSDTDITSRSLALTLEDMGQREAAAIIRKYIE